MPRESTITAAIKRTAEGLGWWVMKIHGGPMQLSGVPDLLCLRNGRAVFLEVKQPGKKPTALQVRRMEEIRKKGGSHCAVVTSVDDARMNLIAYSRVWFGCETADLKRRHVGGDYW